MMPQPTFSSLITPVYRRLEPADATTVCSQYDEEYRPAGGGDPRDYYPYPQLLDPGWVSRAALEPALCWMVAELGGVVVGSAAAVRNIGTGDDRVAEVFGIVVRRAARGHRIGAGLLARLDAALGDDVAVVLCEARTGDERGWKVARSCGFMPVGFEPFAHTTPVGSEAMLLTTRVRASARSRGSAARPVSAAVRALAAIVRGREPPGHGVPSRLTDLDPPARTVAVRRDDVAGNRLLNAWRDRPRHAAGVVNLRRLEGSNQGGRRNDTRFYVADADDDDDDAGFVRVVWDHIDRRARVLDLRSESITIGARLIEAAVADLLAEAADGHLLIAVDLRADALALQSRLEAQGFLPTAYYPVLIAEGPERIDAVQFTRLDRRAIEQSLDLLSGLDWPGARRVVDCVVASGRHAP